MEITKRYQLSPSKPEEPGSKQKLGLDDDVLLVLMYIRLHFPIEDLVF